MELSHEEVGELEGGESHRFAKIQKPFSNEQLVRAGFANTKIQKPFSNEQLVRAGFETSTKMQNSRCNVQMSYS